MAADGGAAAAHANCRRVGESTARRTIASATSDGDHDPWADGNQRGRKPCTTSGLCTLVRPAGVPVAEAQAFFDRTMLHGHAVPAHMVVVDVDVVTVLGHVYCHERWFPKERLATQDPQMMSQLNDSFIVWDKTAVVELRQDGARD